MLPDANKWSLKLQIGGKEVLMLSSDAEPVIDRDGPTFLASRIMSAANAYLSGYLATREMSDETCLKQMGLLAFNQTQQ
jgi:hypothetical protein